MSNNTLVCKNKENVFTGCYNPINKKVITQYSQISYIRLIWGTTLYIKLSQKKLRRPKLLKELP